MPFLTRDDGPDSSHDIALCGEGLTWVGDTIVFGSAINEIYDNSNQIALCAVQGGCAVDMMGYTAGFY